MPDLARTPPPAPTTPAPPPRPDLTATKVIAGAGAAATTAVLGSHLGAAGAITGAALGSVVSTVGTSLYQRSLERTRDELRARVRLPGGRSVPVTEGVEVPAPRTARDAEAAAARVVVGPSARLPERAGPRRRRGWLLVVVTAVLAFGLAVLAVTGLELLKGSTLTAGQHGTSVQRVLTGEGGSPTTAESGPVPTQQPSATSTPSPRSPRTSAPAIPPTTAPGTGERTVPPIAPNRTTPPAPTSTPAPPIELLPGRS